MEGEEKKVYKITKETPEGTYDYLFILITTNF